VTEGKDAESNVTVSHEEEDVIMAESGLNLAELDTQDDRDLIHMVLEDANFEQELEGGPNSAVATSSPNPLRDSGFYSDGNSAGEMSPSPAEDHAALRSRKCGLRPDTTLSFRNPIPLLSGI